MTGLVTFGETMLRYAPPRGKRFENADAFAVHVGGAESNVAVAAARLGCEATWLSKLPDTPFGRRVERTLRGQGVTPEVAWADEGRLGVYYLEPGADPRGASVHYDRADAAVRTATPDELATDRLADADAVCTTGITPALSGTLADTTRSLLETAREAGATTAFDANYRSKLWEPDEARETLTDLLGLVDVLFVAERDAATVFDRTGDAETVGRAFRDAYGHEAVVVTRGAEGAVAVTDDGVHEQPAFDTETVDPVGSGDAFVGGYLARWLDDGDVPRALAYGAATAAVKRTLDGDMALVSRPEVEAVLSGDARISR
ncbi:bifunctional 2-dehydro-3-deoxygluconokinase/2-dehydro-3-deoxygalactonokinase [Haloglomus litoreum]|uniref:bifunctional 2-dehydro-3-deoxygluconokinase/2-dehydro-3- deoxygalactonokinase n=1 Tax=Haloglomus litoreum TaxID=3034026 RepID=UPI0023E87009|nr:bifunctional 2-dehydro-3-deoxygluconokinase/2-dehydro-3-deoxygalactonokinase [Haloglomus sp. DT116]